MKWTTLMGLLVLALAQGCSCDSDSTLSGDSGHEADLVHETADDPAADPPVEPEPEAPDLPVDTPAEDAAEEDVAFDGCCPPPLVLDAGRGICVDPTGSGEPCSEDRESCSFGQLCSPQFGIDYLGDFCEVPCAFDESMLCPVQYVCSPQRCCDIPGEGCIPDPCEPPLLMHVGTGLCVSPVDLGVDCEEEACGEGQTCLEWTGLSGDTFRTCEIECAGNPRLCPNGLWCVDWDDGPRNVCDPVLPSRIRGCDDPGALVCGQAGKFTDVDRPSVCPQCRGVEFCVAENPDGTGRVQSIAPPEILACGELYPPCEEGEIPCRLLFRDETEDCPSEMPSVYWWSTLCALASLDEVYAIHCLPYL